MQKWTGILTIVAAGLAAITVRSDAREPVTSPPVVVAQADETEAPEEKPAPKKRLRGRVPNNYGKLGLSDAQRQTIYGIQAQYKAMIVELEKQIEALEAKRDEEIEGTLTPLQKRRLDEILAEKAKKAAEE